MNKQTLSEAYQAAATHYNAGRFDEALHICDEIIASGPHGDTYNLMAHIADKMGNPDQSISLMNKALQTDSRSSRYNNNMGNILFDQKQFKAATDFFKQAIQYNPGYTEAHFNLGLSLIQCGEHEKALPSFEKALQFNPELIDAYTNIGNIYMKLNQRESAVEFYEKALEFKPGDMVISVNLSLALQSLQKEKKAKLILTQALKKNPNDAELLLNLGTLYQRQKKSEKAIACFKTALENRPKDLKLLYNMGTTLMESGRYTDAIPYFEDALTIAPEDRHTLNNMGLVHFEIGAYEKALEYYHTTIRLHPDFAEAHNNIGLVYKFLENKSKAIDHFQQAATLDPKFGEAFHNLGEAYRESGHFIKALEYCRKAASLVPDLTPAFTHFAYLLRWLCNWEEYDRVEKRLSQLVMEEIERKETIRETPFMNIIRVDDPAFNRTLADNYAYKILKNIENINVTYSLKNRKKSKTNKITLGYFSSNFRNHPMAHLLASLFQHHNRNEFQINCYSIGPDDGSHYRKRFEKDADSFVDLRQHSHAESAQRIFDDQVDILVDLMGYTEGNRLEISALRPAPIQVRYMGMPGTMGGNVFDYIIVDETVLPKDQQYHYAEKFIYMPHTYQINDMSKKISKEPVTRAMFNLPEEAFVFCSFNTSFKIDPVIFSTWMQILRQAENSVLWLMPDIPEAGDNLLQVAAQYDISPDRLIFTEHIPLEKHLARIGLADLALDTLLVNGAATTSDALWGGVPVITILGNRFISRMSASILSAIGLDELIANNIDEYVQLAVSFAKQPDRVERLKKTLTQNAEKMPLFDTLGFTLNLEKAFKKIWNNYTSDLSPQLVDLKETLNTLGTAAALYPHEYKTHIKNLSFH